MLVVHFDQGDYVDGNWNLDGRLYLNILDWIHFQGFFSEKVRIIVHEPVGVVLNSRCFWLVTGFAEMGEMYLV